VLDFKPSSGASVGIELEFQLIDPVTFDLVDGILPLLESCSKNPYIKPEFNQATVEMNSGISGNIHGLEREVYSIVKDLNERCRKLGMAISGGGAHPFSSRLATITPVPRYQSMESMGGYLCHILMTYAFHVHVGMETGEETIALMKGLRPYLPLLMALSASSPFWWGHDTGYACYRNRVLASMRSYGIPPRFESWKEFSNFVESARRACVFSAYDDMHWDVRPRPDKGTIEVRVMDMQPTVREAILLASFVRALVELLRERQKAGEGETLFGSYPHWVEKENHFRASLKGMEAVLIVDDRGNTRPLRDVIGDLLPAVSGAASDLGDGERLRLLEKHLDGGPGYKRQRRTYKETGSFKEVAAYLVRELEEDLAGHASDNLCLD
jgi:carboxylate-amine ligase